MSDTPLSPTHLIFSYGTLQLPQVQMDTFKRPLKGTPDALVGWKQEWLQITDPKVLALSGEAMHPILRYTGEAGDFVLGTALEVSKLELFAADDYEVDDYKRVEADLKSGRKAWIYVAGDTDYPPG